MSEPTYRICPQCDRRFENSDVRRCPHDNERLLVIVNDTDSLLGTVLVERFALTKVLGVGGFATVYSAVQEPVGRQVAVKVLLRERATDEIQVKRFFNEAKSISQLRNQHTIQLYDFGQADNGALFMAMEFSPGVTLSKIILEEQTMDPGRVARIGAQICESLSEAHQKGIIHRDLKPTNVMVETRLSGPDFVKVLDFGIAKLLVGSDDDPITTTGSIAGTPTYMAPEQIKSLPVTHATDLYALGVVLFRALTGQRPIEAQDSVATLMAQINNAPTDIRALMPELPSDYAELIMSLLEKDPNLRPGSAEEVRQKLVELAKISVPKFTDTSDSTRLMPPPLPRTEMTPETIVAKRSFDLGLQETLNAPTPSRGVFDSSVPPQSIPKRTSVLPLGAALIILATLSSMLFYPFSESTNTPTAGTSTTHDQPQKTPKRVVLEANPAHHARNQEMAIPSVRRDLEKKRPPAQQITLTIQSPGAPAAVKLNGKRIGRTPISIKQERSDKTVTVTLHRTGYRRALYKITLMKDQTISVAWRHKKRQNATKPNELMGPDD